MFDHGFWLLEQSKYARGGRLEIMGDHGWRRSEVRPGAFSTSSTRRAYASRRDAITQSFPRVPKCCRRFAERRRPADNNHQWPPSRALLASQLALRPLAAHTPSSSTLLRPSGSLSARKSRRTPRVCSSCFHSNHLTDFVVQGTTQLWRRIWYVHVILVLLTVKLTSHL